MHVLEVIDMAARSPIIEQGYYVALGNMQISWPETTYYCYCRLSKAPERQKPAWVEPEVHCCRPDSVVMLVLLQDQGEHLWLTVDQADS